MRKNLLDHLGLLNGREDQNYSIESTTDYGLGFRPAEATLEFFDNPTPLKAVRVPLQHIDGLVAELLL